MQFTNDDVSDLTAILAGAAETEILPRFKSLRDGEVRTKTSVFDPVTEADEAAERVITAELRRRWPGALVVGEEGTAADPSLLAQLAEAVASNTTSCEFDSHRHY